MIFSDISNIRLASQHITNKSYTTVKEVVGYMGAMQAQDYAMAKWAIGTRLPNSTDKMIEAAIDKGEILRTHLLRPTWHIVSADDIHWLLELTAPHIIASLKARHKELELTESVLKKIYAVFEKKLSGGNHLTREALISMFGKENISIDGNRAYHILLRAELDGILCSGSTKDKKQTYALLNERVPKTHHLTRDEALERIARKYFSSHCPATLKDFVWWSGLSVTDAKKGLEAIKQDFVSETIGSDTYWFANSVTIPSNEAVSVHLLPAFDEFLISYTNRKASICTENQQKAIYSNGIFRPIIVINGQVAGTWKRTQKKEKIVVETNFFQPPSPSDMNLIEKKAIELESFWGKKNRTGIPSIPSIGNGTNFSFQLGPETQTDCICCKKLQTSKL